MPSTLTSNTDPLIFGSDQALLAFYTGKIAEVKISNTIRSAAWLLTEYRNQSAVGTYVTQGTETTAPASVTFSHNLIRNYCSLQGV